MRSGRRSTLQAVTELSPLPIDAAVADQCAQLRLLLAQTGRRMNVSDSWIAATALAHQVALVTQDSDFDVLSDVGELHVIRV